jgi:uncharacterized membrane protein
MRERSGAAHLGVTDVQRPYRFLAFTLLLLLLPRIAAPQSDTDVQVVQFALVNVPDAPATLPRALNDRGQIVGTRLNIFDPIEINGFMFSNGSFSTVAFAQAIENEAFDINNRGTIVGTYVDAQSRPHGFIRAQGNFKTLDYPGAEETGLNGINDAGDIVGSFSICGFFSGCEIDRKAFLLRNGIFSEIAFPGATFTFLHAINNAGQIVGVYFDTSGIHGFLVSHGNFQTIDIPGAVETEATDINNRGDIVGRYQVLVDGVGQDHGFLLRNGHFSTIDIPGAIATRPSGINDLGAIVGESSLGGFFAIVK